MSETVSALAALLVILEKRLRYLDDHPTVPGGEREYQQAMERYRDIDRRLDRVMWEEIL